MENVQILHGQSDLNAGKTPSAGELRPTPAISEGDSEMLMAIQTSVMGHDPPPQVLYIPVTLSGHV